MKEGESIELGFFPKDENKYKWLDSHGVPINVDGKQFKEIRLPNEEYVLTINNISKTNPDSYSVICSNGRKTSPVNVTILCKLSNIALNLLKLKLSLFLS